MSSKGVLILGETGSGKSTFINTITNYFRDGSLQDLRIAIPTMYFQATEEFQNNESNTRDPTISQTDSCITYSFTQDGMRFSFVDTPGLNDSRGTKQDELNIDKILAAAHNEKDLSAILLVINATQPRINPALKAVFVSLKGNIPNSVLDNTVVVLTKTREDTTAFQRSVLAEVAPNLQRNSIFYMDNTAFVSKPKNGRLIKSDILNAEWKTSMKTCSKIVDRIRGFSQVATDDFAKMRRNRFELKRILNNVKLEMTNLQQMLEQLAAAEQKQKQLANDQQTFKNYTQKTVTKVKQPKATTYHNTICAQCDHVCHQHCGLGEISEKGHNAFQGCYAMAGGNNCRRCPGECSYTEHYHAKQIFVEVDKTVESVLDDIKSQYEAAVKQSADVQMEVNTLASARAAVNSAMQQKVDDLRGVCDTMKKICSGFNFAEELRVTLNQLKLELKSLRSIEAQDSAHAVINAFEVIIDEYSKVDANSDSNRGPISRPDLDMSASDNSSDDNDDNSDDNDDDSDDTSDDSDDDSDSDQSPRYRNQQRQRPQPHKTHSRSKPHHDKQYHNHQQRHDHRHRPHKPKHAAPAQGQRRSAAAQPTEAEVDEAWANIELMMSRTKVSAPESSKAKGTNAATKGGAKSGQRNDSIPSRGANSTRSANGGPVSSSTSSSRSGHNATGKAQTCKDCHGTWSLSPKEYDYFVIEKRGAPPKRCRECRARAKEGVMQSESAASVEPREEPPVDADELSSERQEEAVAPPANNAKFFKTLFNFFKRK